MILDELIDQLTALRAAAAGASIANVRIMTRVWPDEAYGAARPIHVDRPVDRVFYQGGEIVLAGPGE